MTEKEREQRIQELEKNKKDLLHKAAVYQFGRFKAHGKDRERFWGKGKIHAAILNDLEQVFIDQHEIGGITDEELKIAKRGVQKKRNAAKVTRNGLALVS